MRKRNRQLLLVAAYFSFCTPLSSFRTGWRARTPATTRPLRLTEPSSDLSIHKSDEDKSSDYAPDGFLAAGTSKLNLRALGRTTRELLTSTQVGKWNRSAFETVEVAMAAWSKGNSKHAALKVEGLLRRVVQEQMSGNPNADGVDMTALYTILIIAWANSGARGGVERAEEILDYFQDIYEKGESDDPLLCGPGLECFNAIIYAYARTGRRDASDQAMRVLRKLYDLNRAKRTLVAPSKDTYAGVLRACATTENGPELIRKLLDHMETLSVTYPLVKPDYRCHNAYLEALLEGINRGNKHISGPKAALMAEEYLHGMLANPDKEVHVSSPNCARPRGAWKRPRGAWKRPLAHPCFSLFQLLSSKPCRWSFNVVLLAWARSRAVDLVDRAEALMKQLEEYHERSGRSEKTQPNSYTYNSLLSCYSRSTLPDKGERTHALLRKMKRLADSGVNPAAGPDTGEHIILPSLKCGDGIGLT